MMTSKERMLCALNREKPDRLPVTIHQWQRYHLNKYMNGMSDIEANRACGLDASITVFRLDGETNDKWKMSQQIVPDGGDRYKINIGIHTPEGDLSCVYGGNSVTAFVTEHPVKEEEDIYLIKKYMPVPKLDRELVKKKYDELGDDGIIRSFVCGRQGGCWQDACELYGTQEMIYQAFDNPEWVHEFLGILLDWKLKYIEESLPNLPIDLMEMGGGASSNNVISPSMHEEFCLPYDIKIHDALKSLGYKTVYHTCGGMTKIADLLAQNHSDANETLSPSGVGGDIDSPEKAAIVYNALHPTKALIGGIDQFNVLGKGSFADIDAEVDRAFNWYGKDGGYIMSASDHFFDAPMENLKHFADAAKKYKY